MSADRLLWLFCFGITGCTLGPDYVETLPPLPAHWQTTTAAEAKQSAAQLSNWWQHFNDATLTQLIEQANSQNLEVKIALARIAQARAERKGIRAELFPSINAVAGAQRQQNPFPGFAPGLKFDLFELGFDALWEIDLFGRQERRLEASKADLQSAQALHAQTLISLNAEVARFYIEYRSQTHQLRITRHNLQAQEKTLALTESLFTAGVGTRHDVVRARAQTENTAALIPSLEAAQTATQHQIENLLAQPPGSLSTVLQTDTPLPTSPVLPLLISPAEVIRQRPDIRAAERQLAAATAMQGAAIAELFPKISLSAFLGLRNTDIETLFKSAAFSYGTAANLLQPLLNFGRIQAGIDLADAKQQAAYLHYQQLILSALQEVETSTIEFLKAEIRRQTLTRVQADTQESVRLSQLRYQEGVSSFLDVLDAQRASYLADLELAKAEAAALIDLIAVYKALGGGYAPQSVEPT